MSALTELKERLSDRWWRLNNLYYIVDDDGNRVLFRPNWAQSWFLQDMHYLNCLLKARQMGFSTAIQIDMLDRALFNSNYSCGVIADTKENAQDIFDRKIKFAFDNLPDALKKRFKPRQDSVRKLEFANGSSITVGTALRGGTYQYLHVSELGKIAVKYPAKAREIRTGAFNTVHLGNIITVESTAEGSEGEFYDLVERSRKGTEQARHHEKGLHAMEWKFHFMPWWKHPDYTVVPDGITIPAYLVTYFKELREKHGVKLTRGQKAWYTLKIAEQGEEDMRREYPSHPDEAFQTAVEGAYYKSQMLRLRQQGRITRVPYSEELPVHTAWDIGMNDHTAIWFFQLVGREIRVIDYYENNNESIAFYARKLAEFADEKGYSYGRHFGPHDLEVRDFSQEEAKTRKDVAESHGIFFEVIPRVANHMDGIEAVRQTLPLCYFDEAGAAKGIAALERYRREWNDKMGVYRSTPRHDDASHGAKAFEQLARADLFGSQQGGARDVEPAPATGWT